MQINADIASSSDGGVSFLAAITKWSGTRESFSRALTIPVPPATMTKIIPKRLVAIGTFDGQYAWSPDDCDSGDLVKKIFGACRTLRGATSVVE